MKKAILFLALTIAVLFISINSYAQEPDPPVISNSTGGNIYENYLQMMTPVIDYQITASNLIDDLTITAVTNGSLYEPCQIEISLSPDDGFTSQIILSPVEGSINTTIYVRPGCEIPFYIYGSITHTSSNATSNVISVTISNEYLYQYAPIVEIGNIEALPNSSVNVPVTALNFNGVGVIGYYIDFDPTVLTFIGLQNIYQSLPYCIYHNCPNQYPQESCSVTEYCENQIYNYILINLIEINSSRSRLFILIRQEMDQFSVPDNEKLFDIVFNYSGGVSTLEFTDGSYYRYSGNTCGGNYCEPEIINEPLNNFYINGSVGPAQTPVISNSTNGFIEQYFVSPQSPPPGSYHLNAVNLTDDLLISSSMLAAYPEGCTIGFSLNPENGFLTQLNISPTEGVIDATVYYRILYNEGISEWEGWIVHSSAGAAGDMIFADLASDYWTIDAPVTTLGHILGQPGSDVIVPLVVHNLQETGVGEYYIDFDPRVLTFNGIGNLHPVFANHFAVYNNCSNPSVCMPDPYQAYIISDDIPVSESLSRVFIHWNEEINYGGWPLIPDGTLMELYFSYPGGTSQLTFTDGYYKFSGNSTPMDPIIINEPFENFYINGSVGPLPITVNLELNLEGLYNITEGKMNQAQGRQFAVGIADEITVGLALSIIPYSIVFETDPVLLNRNGLCTIEIPGSFNDNYYVVIKHRNSIETWSAIPVDFSGSEISCNFSASADAVFGNNVKLIGSKYCIYSGDINQDGIIDIFDMTLLDNDVAAFTQGYNITDLNGDGNADTGDMTIVDNNASGFVGKIKPGNN